MSYRQLKEKYGESKEEHFDDSYDYIRYLERCGDKAGANDIRRGLEMENEEIIIEDPLTSTHQANSMWETFWNIFESPIKVLKKLKRGKKIPG